MIRFIATTVLILNIGLVHSCAIKKCADVSESKTASSSYSAQESESEYQASHGACGTRSYEKERESKVQQSSSSSYQSRSMSTSETEVDVSYFENAFSKCSLIDKCHRELYINYLRKCGSKDICLWKKLIQKLNCNERCFRENFKYELVYKKFNSIYQKLVQKKFYVSNCNWAEKMSILQEYKSELMEVLDIIKEEEILYGPLKYCLHNNLEYLPMVCGIFEVMFQQQKSYYSSSTTVQKETTYQTKSVSTQCETEVDVSFFESAFSQCSVIDKCHRELYINYLRKCGSKDICLWKKLVQKLNCKERCFRENFKYELVYKKFNSIYQKLVQKKFYVSNCNWAEKMSILQEYKSELMEVLDIVKEEEILYGPLNYCLHNNLEYLPMVCGLFEVMFQQQKTYYSSTTEVSQTSTRSTSTSSCSQSSHSYKSVLSKCSSIQEVERNLYEQYLSEMSEENLVIMQEYWKYLNCKEQFLTQEMITDFSIFQEKIKYIHEMFIKEQIYTKECNWMQKMCLFKKAKRELEALMKCIKKDCWLYKSLCWCLEEKNMHYMPIIIGFDNIICSSQSSYFSQSSSSSYSQSSTTEVKQESSSASGVSKSCGC